jgi:hypothetical protein
VYTYRKETTVRELTPPPPGPVRAAVLRTSGKTMVRGALTGLNALADDINVMERRDPHAAKEMKLGMSRELRSRKKSIDRLADRFSGMGIVNKPKKKKKHRSREEAAAPPTRTGPPLPLSTDSEGEVSDSEVSDIPYNEFLDGGYKARPMSTFEQSPVASPLVPSPPQSLHRSTAGSSDLDRRVNRAMGKIYADQE